MLGVANLVQELGNFRVAVQTWPSIFGNFGKVLAKMTQKLGGGRQGQRAPSRLGNGVHWGRIGCGVLVWLDEHKLCGKERQVVETINKTEKKIKDIAKFHDQGSYKVKLQISDRRIECHKLALTGCC